LNNRTTLTPNHHLWLLAILLLLFSGGLIHHLDSSRVQTLERELTANQNGLTLLFGNSFATKLREYDRLLENLSMQLLATPLPTSESAHRLLQQAALERPELLGIVMVSPAGDFRYTSMSADISHFPNLLQQSASRESFLFALESPRMEIGQTYYFAPEMAWVIPLRKTIRDRHGTPIAVMITGIRLSDQQMIGFTDAIENGVLLLNDRTRYRIYWSGQPLARYPAIYGTPIADAMFQGVNAQLVERGMSIEDLRQQQRPVTLKIYSPILRTEAYFTSLFVPEYNFWVITNLPAEKLEQPRREALFTYLVLIGGADLIIFLLLWRLTRTEQRLRDKLHHQAQHDPLTGLLNRHFLLSQRSQLEQADAHPTLILIDLDRFKSINDHFGHPTGDRVLQEVAIRLRQQLSEQQWLLRLGGDEFLVVLPDSSADTARQLVDRLLTALRRPCLLDERTFQLGASIGMAQRQTDETLEQLLANADLAMYAAKQQRNSVVSYSEALRSASEQRFALEQQLLRAIPERQISLQFQPQLSATGELHGVEALARWHSPVLGWVPPDQFIPIAEEIGMMPELGDHIIALACSELRTIWRIAAVPLRLSINLSISQLLQPDFTTKLLTHLQQQQIDPRRLTLEVTESIFAEAFTTIAARLGELKAEGIAIAIDDFGTGYSSLSMLQKMPLDELKIDKSFIDQIDDPTSRQQPLVASILDIANHFKIQPVVEGVESEMQRDLLLMMGCPLFQGYLFSRPLSSQQLLSYLVAQSGADSIEIGDE